MIHFGIEVQIKFLCFVVFLALATTIFAAGIRINEISASNHSSYYDEWYDNPDWIELYNSSDKPVNLAGYRIGDKCDFSGGWVIPDTVIKPRGFLVLHADSKNLTHTDNYIVRAGGAGIYPGLESDGFGFFYKPVTGDFDISVRVNSMTGIDLMGKAGLIARSSIYSSSKYFGILCANPARDLYSILMRDSTGAKSKAINHIAPINYPFCWVKLASRGDSLFCYLKFDSYNWIEVCNMQVQLGKKIYIGLACSAGDYLNKKVGNFSFSELFINGEKADCAKLNKISIPESVYASSGYSKSLHTGFKLNANGETLFLWNKEGNIVDTMVFSSQRTDVSFERYPDGMETCMFSAEPTPGAANKRGYAGYCEKPRITAESGFYSDTIKAEISACGKQEKAYFTFDGRMPDTTQNKYSGQEISICRNTSLRAIACESAKLPSLPSTKSYFFNEKPSLPVVSIVSDSLYLWSPDLGLLADKNHLAGWEIPVHFDYWLPEAGTVYSSDAGLKLHGQASRENPQRSFRLAARRLYENDSFNFGFWGSNGPAACNKFVLKNGGQDWYFSLIKDAFAWALAKNLDNVLSFAYNPAIVYINGNYWGLYQFRERFDEEYLAEKYSINASGINILEDNSIKLGSAASFFENYYLLPERDLAIDSNYMEASLHFDADNIIEHTIIRTFAGVYDWPCYNNKAWQSGEIDGKWRWILHDLELSFGTSYAVPEINMFRIIRESDCYTANILKKMLENQNFRNKFLNKYADCLNSFLKPVITIPLLDSLAGVIRNEIPRHRERWKGSVTNWENEIEIAKEFLEKRNNYVFNQLASEFRLEGTVLLKVGAYTDSSCTYKINSLVIDTPDWEGTYFRKIPVEIRCLPKPGYRFVKWLGGEPNGINCRVDSDADTLELMAVLVKDEDIEPGSIVINEIMYKPADDKDCRDWVELYNNSDLPADLTGWALKDDNDGHAFVFPEGTLIMPREYINISEDTMVFKEYYPGVCSPAGNIGFGFGRGDAVRLFDNNGKLIDIVEYSNELPWDANADGKGYTLELINPSLDNNLYSNWSASAGEGGTPCSKNSAVTGITAYLAGELTYSFYPNPTGKTGNLQFSADCSSVVSAELYTMIGRKEMDIVRPQYFNAGLHTTPVDFADIEPGLYMIKLNITSGINSFKIIPVIIK